jgi:hypothetical protein
MKNLLIIVAILFISNFAFAIRIYSVTHTANLNDDCIIYITYFFSDNDTPSDPKDDKFMGTDVIMKCRDAQNFRGDDLNLGHYLPKLKEPEFEKYNLIRSMKYGEFNKNKERLLKEVDSLEKIKVEENREIKVIKTIKN